MSAIKPLALWTFATPNGWKASIMIEELREAGVELPPVDVHTVNIMHREQFSEVYTAINPNQRIPGLVHGEVRLSIYAGGYRELSLGSRVEMEQDRYHRPPQRSGLGRQGASATRCRAWSALRSPGG